MKSQLFRQLKHKPVSIDKLYQRLLGDFSFFDEQELSFLDTLLFQRGHGEFFDSKASCFPNVFDACQATIV